jgi:hypothetical protein
MREGTEGGKRGRAGKGDRREGEAEGRKENVKRKEEKRRS